MVTIVNVEKLLLMGNTYANLELIRETGARWDNSHRCWILEVARHPLNNAKQRTKLKKMLDTLEERGVRFVSYLLDGAVRQ